MNNLIVFTGEYLIYIIGLVFVVLLFRKLQAGILIVTIVSAINALILAFVIGEMVRSVRPFVLEHTMPLIRHGADNGFPSHHVLIAMTMAAVAFLYDRNLGLALCAAALLVGVARVMAGVHHPVDVIGSVAIALVAVFIAKRTVG